MLARIEVDGGDPLVELAALEGWLRSAPELRGLVRRERAAPRPGEMGALGDVLVAALGGGGAITALAAALGTWLMTRRGQVSIKVAGGGHQVEIDIKSADPEALLRTILAGGVPLPDGQAVVPAAKDGTGPAPDATGPPADPAVAGTGARSDRSAG